MTAAILADATANGGRVSLNRTRADLRGHVPPKLIGLTVRAMIREGLLCRDGWETSDDHAGGNAGKPARTYRVAS